MCPFCYIGKRKFEHALSQFPHKEAVNVVWKSFLLNPDLQTQPNKTLYQYLAETKGMTLTETHRMTEHVAAMGNEVGLTFHFDKAVVASSHDAHRLIQLAKQNGLGDAIEERLFRAYFTESRDTSDHTTLLELGTDVGLDAEAVKHLLETDQHAEAVAQDVYEAQQVGVRGVPFFALNRQYAISGAQQPETFLKALHTAWGERAVDSALS